MIHDITPPITRDLKVWPGDLPPTREVLSDLRRGDAVTTSALRATVHLGAHADAPSHYHTDAPSIGECDLAPYIGPCQIIRVSLHAHGARLVGIDTPSIDAFDSKDLPTHHAALKHNMAILEGLILDPVPEGMYELIALPLKLVGFDASPVRAILRPLDSQR